ncbi:MAG: hypothetical protein AB8G95_04850 [Anaerolineae bacterium]
MDIPAIFLSLENSFLFSASLVPVWLILVLVLVQISDRAIFLIPGLLATYLFSGIVVSWTALPHIAFTTWAFGTFTCLILYLSVRQLSARTTPQVLLQEQGYRVLIGLALGIIAWLIGTFTAFPSGVMAVSACIWALILLGGFRFLTAKRGMEIGIGLLLILAGFGVWLTAVNQSAVIVGMWAAGSILLALAIGWLTDRTEGAKGKMPTISEQFTISQVDSLE